MKCLVCEQKLNHFVSLYFENKIQEEKESQLTEELAWREKQEIAELQEQAIIEDEWKYREYAQEQLEKLEQEKKDENN